LLDQHTLECRVSVVFCANFRELACRAGQKPPVSGHEPRYGAIPADSAAAGPRQ